MKASRNFCCSNYRKQVPSAFFLGISGVS